MRTAPNGACLASLGDSSKRRPPANPCAVTNPEDVATPPLTAPASWASRTGTAHIIIYIIITPLVMITLLLLTINKISFRVSFKNP